MQDAARDEDPPPTPSRAGSSGGERAACDHLSPSATVRGVFLWPNVAGNRLETEIGDC